MIKIDAITELATSVGWENVRTIRCDASSGRFFRRSGAHLMCHVAWNGDVTAAVMVTPDGVTDIVGLDAARIGGVCAVAARVQTHIMRYATPVSLVKNDTRPAWLRWVQSED